MTCAVIIGWIMTRLILSLLFYSIITGIAILTRIIGKDFLNLKKITKGLIGITAIANMN